MSLHCHGHFLPQVCLVRENCGNFFSLTSSTPFPCSAVEYALLSDLFLIFLLPFIRHFLLFPHLRFKAQELDHILLSYLNKCIISRHAFKEMIVHKLNKKLSF